MVAHPGGRPKLSPGEIGSYRASVWAKGTVKGKCISVWVGFTPRLFDLIRAEAELRGWSVAAMIRHLCEASIDGIE